MSARRRGVVAAPYATGQDPDAENEQRAATLHRIGANGSVRTVTIGEDYVDQEYARDKRRARNARLIRAELDAEERAAGGDESAFVEVDWSSVKPKTSVPLDEDGVFLQERIHWISGPAGSGKTMLAYWKMLQRARRHQHSAIYECEMGEELAMGLLRNLGATNDDLKFIHYFRAEEEGAVVDLVAHGRAFCRMLLARGIRAVLYDALNPLMVASARNENVAADVRAWVTAACLPLSMVGGLVVVLDHTGREHADRSRGSSDKPAAGHVDIVLAKTEPFARGVSGAIELTCNKDRTGSIVDGAVLGIRVEANADGSVGLKPDEEWASVEGKIRPQRIGKTRQQEIAGLITETGHPLTIAEIAEQLKLEYETVRSAVRRGMAGGEPVFVKQKDEKIAVIDRSRSENRPTGRGRVPVG